MGYEGALSAGREWMKCLLNVLIASTDLLLLAICP